MVIGNGLIATRFSSFKEDDQVVIFASGISNSKTADTAAYGREARLLSECLEIYTGKTFIYFSTCGFYDIEEQQSAYLEHKGAMERLIQEKANQYYIFRISNLAGNTPNPNTVLNFFYNHIVEQSHFNLWEKTWRNIIDMDDAYSIITYIIRHHLFTNSIVNITNIENYPVKKIVTAFEDILAIKAHYTSIDKGSFFKIDCTDIIPVIKELKINFDEYYLGNLIKKYFLNKHDL